MCLAVILTFRERRLTVRRKEVWYAVIGGFVGAVVAIAAGWVLPTGAQTEVKDAEFDFITCRGINVVHSKGSFPSLIMRVNAETGGGDITVYDKDGSISVCIRDNVGGEVPV